MSCLVVIGARSMGSPCTTPFRFRPSAQPADIKLVLYLGAW